MIFYQQDNIGSCKYVISYYDGFKTHRDGSKFYDIATFSNKKKVKIFTNNLISRGYREVNGFIR